MWCPGVSNGTSLKTAAWEQFQEVLLWLWSWMRYWLLISIYWYLLTTSTLQQDGKLWGGGGSLHQRVNSTLPHFLAGSNSGPCTLDDLHWNVVTLPKNEYKSVQIQLESLTPFRHRVLRGALPQQNSWYSTWCRVFRPQNCTAPSRQLIVLTTSWTIHDYSIDVAQIFWETLSIFGSQSATLDTLPASVAFRHFWPQYYSHH